MLFRMLGVPEVYDERVHRGVRLTSSMQGTLLGALMGRPGAPVTAERLVHELWGDDPPAKAGNALQAHVSRLRQTLALVEPERGNRSRLLTDRAGYVLRADERETDSGRFRLSVLRARRLAEREPHAAYHQLRQALALWRGEVLEGSVRGPICAGVAAELEQVRQDALEALFDTALRTGRQDQVSVSCGESSGPTRDGPGSVRRWRWRCTAAARRPSPRPAWGPRAGLLGAFGRTAPCRRPEAPMSATGCAVWCSCWPRSSVRCGPGWSGSRHW